MPRGNGTGPMGIGLMTGRGAGFCAGNTVPGFMNPTLGRGRAFGMCMGWRHGWRNQGYQSNRIAGQKFYTSEDDLTGLKNRASYLGDVLQSINSRINELEMEKK